MALGESIGFANQVSRHGIAGEWMVVPWRDLLGDPTLRMHAVKPVQSVADPIDNTNGTVTLSWTAAPGDAINSGSDPVAGFVGYHVYKATSFDSPFERVTTDLVTGLSTAVPGSTTDVYMVRAVKLETTPSGTYFNAGQGTFTEEL